MAGYTLDDIRAAADRKYGSTDISLDDTVTVRLLNPLRLSRSRRDELATLQDRMAEEGADQEGLMKEALLLVADTPAKGKALLKAIGDDLATLAATFEAYGAGTQMGEASASAA